MAAAAADGKTLFAASDQIGAWSVDTAKPIAIVKQPQDLLYALSLSSDGKFAACAGHTIEGSRLRFVDTSTGKIVFEELLHDKPMKPLQKTDVTDHLPGVICTEFSPRGGWFAISQGGTTIDFCEVTQLTSGNKKLSDAPKRFCVASGTSNPLSFHRTAPMSRRLRRAVRLARRRVKFRRVAFSRHRFANPTLI